ncbi:hypothetical protein GT002_13060 [Streptomyces sp. SID4917]|nr:hypothetical protein [Streptomyces sp. SID4917]SCF80152.1 DNA end-binding protein Ku [Streptomyces sp. MnatMP-M17]
MCEVCGQTLSWEKTGSAYELADGALVEVTDTELDALPLDSTRAIEVAGFSPAGAVEPLSLGRAYHLIADGDIAARPYAILVRALQCAERNAVVKFVLRNREQIGLLRVQGNALVLHRLLAPDEVHPASALAPAECRLSIGEVSAALVLADTLSADGLEGFTDAYTEALTE